MYINEHIKDYLRRRPNKLGWAIITLVLGIGIYKCYYIINALYQPNSPFGISSPFIKMTLAWGLSLLTIIQFLLGTLLLFFVRSLKDNIVSSKFSRLTKMAAVILVGAWLMSLFTEWKGVEYEIITLPVFLLLGVLFLWFYVNEVLRENPESLPLKPKKHSKRKP